MKGLFKDGRFSDFRYIAHAYNPSIRGATPSQRDVKSAMKGVRKSSSFKQ
tara:strand:- start:2559 stop:2708 length:150 start_codon:yes stop_codon:yes gene_type:complete